ncbi:peptidoglycan-binding protein [Streptomyces populi]|uniref:Peptidoglycan-binding protein n=1 Tax=Streptomyces populi TaxID=2058924 RepID=A0A2I0SHI7_9ACTN|nr:peptidoglycan-binding domain-containing protein [Streptomyces populi]PKT69393.1 peptidoglycan-binding protein [Streptomyces populi]
MTEPTGHVCPECAAYRAQDGSPSCACARTASDALRNKRTAQAAAAAEDFNPLRIRPYVELGPEDSGYPGEGWAPAGDTGVPVPAGTAAGPWHAAPTPGEPWAPAEAGVWTPEGTSAYASGGAPVGGVEPWGAVDGVPPAGGVPMPPANGAGAAASTVHPGTIPADATMQLGAVPADATMQLGAVPADATARSAPLPAEAVTPSAPLPADATMRLKALPSEAHATDVRLFPEGSRPSEHGRGDSSGGRPGRRRRAGVLAVTGVVVTVVAAAGAVSGLLSSDPPSQEEARPKGVSASAPEVLSDTESAVPSASASATASASSSPSASVSASPSASESETSATPSSSATASPTSARPSPTATATESADPAGGGGSNAVAGPTLQIGDSGSEVTELQLRLGQLRMYNTRRAGDRFDHRLEDAVRWYQWARGITGDSPGVYGPATRASLEAETSEP